MTTPADRFLRHRLRFWRVRSGLTQAEVAERCGISTIYYQSIEAGRRTNLPLHTIEKLAAALGRSIHSLFASETAGSKVLSIAAARKPPKPADQPVHPKAKPTRKVRRKI